MPTELPPPSPPRAVGGPAASGPWWQRLWQGSFGRIGRLVYERVLRPVLGINDSPRSIALGLAIGVFVAMTPTVGIQMPIVFVLCSLGRGNRVAGLAMTWISNPVTTLPMYYGYYRLGLLFTGGEEARYEDLRGILEDKPGEDADLWSAVVRLIEHLGWPLWIGSLVVAVIATAPVYPLAHRYFKRRQSRLARPAEGSSS